MNLSNLVGPRPPTLNTTSHQHRHSHSHSHDFEDDDDSDDDDYGARAPRLDSGLPRPYHCDWGVTCDKAFARKSDLVRHLRIHYNDRPYACPYKVCGKTFIQRSALTVHIRTHTGEKPHVCNVCSRAFADSSSLARHRRVHTGRRPYTCGSARCQKTFCRKVTLTKHMHRHHPNEAIPVSPTSTDGFAAHQQRSTRNKKGASPSPSLASSAPSDGLYLDVHSHSHAHPRNAWSGPPSISGGPVDHAHALSARSGSMPFLSYAPPAHSPPAYQHHPSSHQQHMSNLQRRASVPTHLSLNVVRQPETIQSSTYSAPSTVAAYHFTTSAHDGATGGILQPPRLPPNMATTAAQSAQSRPRSTFAYPTINNLAQQQQQLALQQQQAAASTSSSTAQSYGGHHHHHQYSASTSTSTSQSASNAYSYAYAPPSSSAPTTPSQAYATTTSWLPSMTTADAGLSNYVPPYPGYGQQPSYLTTTVGGGGSGGQRLESYGGYHH